MPGRNDPCPCGSGKKYKRCCEASDLARERTGRRLHLVEGGAPVPAGLPEDVPTKPWEIALVPMLASLADDPAARPVALLTVSDGFVIGADILNRPPAEPAELAPIVERAVLTAIGKLGVTPGRVHVRHESVAAELAPRLAARGIGVAAVSELPGAAEAARGLHDQFSGGPPGALLLSHPDTWAGWGLPRELVAELFSASAAYHRAAPWRVVPDDRILRTEVPGGRTWWIMVLGNAGEQFGISLFENAGDIEQLFADSDPMSPFARSEGVMVSITFDRGGDVPRPTRQEIREARWEIAGPAAYPQLMVLNTPGGGITQGQVRDLISCLRAVPRFVEQHRQILEDDRLQAAPLRWHDEPSGVAMELVDVTIVDEGLWDVPETLSTSGPEGPGARPGVTLGDMPDEERAALVESTLGRFVAWLERSGKKPLSPAVARRHATALRPFLDSLVHGAGVSPQAVSEYDLRDFLYRWYPLKVLDGETGARSLPGSMRRFFDFLAQSEGVLCPWADQILRDREAFLHRWETRPFGTFMDNAVQEWVVPFTLDLHARLLLPAPGVESEVEWREFMGPIEAELWDELHRRWLVWRDEAIREGISERGPLLAALTARQRAWERAPNPRAAGKTPARAVAREQSRTPAWPT
jgi:hypothetical protein